MAQAGSNYEKNGGPKSRWTVPLRKRFLLLQQSRFVAFLEAKKTHILPKGSNILLW